MTIITVLNFSDEKPSPCRIQDSLIEDLKPRFRGRVEFDRINVDENEEMKKKYSIKEVPTIVIEKEGKEIERFVGLTQQVFLKRAIERALNEKG